MVDMATEISEDDGGLSGNDWLGTDNGPPSPAGSARSESGEEPPSAGDGPSQPIQKRRRVTRACDECRRKKIKCDGKQPCTHCSVYSYECTYDKPSNRRRNPAPQYIEALEGRLQRAETLLRKFMPDVDLADPNLDPAVQQEFHNREQARARANKMQQQPTPSIPSSNQSQQNDQQILSMINSAGQLDLDDKGGWDFQGISSGAVFLKRMKEHFRGMLGPSNKAPFLPRGERQTNLTTLDPPTPSTPFSTVSNQYAELPSKDVARNLCYYSLSCATCLVRIVHIPTFYARLDKVYDRPIDSLDAEDQHFMGLVYAVLALGCMYDNLDGASPRKMAYQEAIDEGMKYFKSARALLQDITECRDLTSLQALLFMILFLQATSNLSACYSFVGIALRSALRIGLHRHLQHEQINTVEDQVRRRVFYVIRQLDIYVSTLLGFPLLLNVDDVDQPFPIEVDDDFITPNAILQPPPGSSSFFEAFNAHTRLMEILAQVTKYVYPMQGAAHGVRKGSERGGKSASTYSISYARIKEIEGDLQVWFEQLPERWRPSPDGPIEVVRVRHLLRFAYAHVQLVLYRPFLHYVSPRLSHNNKIDDLSYACAAAAISVSRNIVHIGLEIRKQRVLSGPYWFMLYTEFFAVLSLVFYAIENPEKPGSAEVLADARAGRQMIADLAEKSLAAERVSDALKGLFEQLPERLDSGRGRPPSSKKRGAPPASMPGSVPMFSGGRQSSVSSQRTEELARARSGGISNGAFNTPNSGVSVDAMHHMSEPRFQSSSFAANIHDMLPLDISSRATSGSPSTASSSHQQQPNFSGSLGTSNTMHKLDTLMFPSEDPFAYPNQPMMELGYQPRNNENSMMPMSSQAQDSQFFFTSGMNDVDSQLLGQPPPYMIQGPQHHQPGMEFSTNMYDPGMFGVQMGQPQRPPQSMSNPSHPYPHQRRQRRQEQQIDQIFTEHGMQADFGNFFGSGRGGFQGM